MESLECDFYPTIPITKQADKKIPKSNNQIVEIDLTRFNFI